MNPRLLIDGVVRQTTVLIAQLSTAAGLRSPLAHVADQVFLSLAQEIEQQGVSRKVVADMFGLALRSYQRKVQRLSESSTSAGRTLWEVVLDFVSERGPVRRSAVLERFQNDDDRAVIAVLSDLVTTGLVYASGRGETTVYKATSEADRRELSREEADEALAMLLWGSVFRRPGLSTRELVATTRADAKDVVVALERLLADERITREGDSEDAPLRSSAFLIPVGAPVGWEAAVFDHFQAVANAIAAKARGRVVGAPADASVGGSTLHFGIYPGHPHEERVLGVLARIRAELNVLWNEVASYNRENPIPDEAATRVTFYFGQYVVPPADAASDGDPKSDGPEGARE